MNIDSDVIRGIIFDLDGTLVDSHLDFDALRQETGCPQGVGLLEYLDTIEDGDKQRQVKEVIQWHEESGARSATWMDGAEEFLRVLSERDVRIGVFTRNSREIAGVMLARLGVPCDDLVAREDAPAKPDPAGIHKMLADWQLEPNQVLCLGDFRYDLEAAKAAGISAGLYDPSGDSPYRALADFCVAHFDELLEAWIGS